MRFVQQMATDKSFGYSLTCELFQHPMMSPYGTPVPYPALYPPAGVYAHPSIPMVIIIFSLYAVKLYMTL